MQVGVRSSPAAALPSLTAASVGARLPSPSSPSSDGPSTVAGVRVSERLPSARRTTAEPHDSVTLAATSLSLSTWPVSEWRTGWCAPGLRPSEVRGACVFGHTCSLLHS